MKILKRLTALVCAALLALSLTACAQSSFEYDKAAAETRALEIIDVIKTEDYAAIVALFRDDLEPLTTAADFEAAWEPYLTPAGAFVEVLDINTVGQTDESGEEYILALVRCRYEHKKYLYTIVMDTDLNLTGLYLK